MPAASACVYASQSSFSMSVAVDKHNRVDSLTAGGSVKIFLPNTVTMWPWPRRVNQYFSEVEVEAVAWFASFNAFGAGAQHAFDRIQCDLLGCLAYPNASKVHVRIACDWMRIAFFIDEYSDVVGPNDVRKQKSITMDALHNPDKPRPEGEWIGGEIVRQFWSRTIHDAGAQSQKRFIAAFEKFLESLVNEAIDRSEYRIRDIPSYIEMRRDTVGLRSFFALLELGLDIPDEVISHPTIVVMANACLDMVALDNQARGGVSHNMITIVMNELDTDKKFLEAMSAIPKWGDPIDSQVTEYCDGLGNWVRANYEWKFESERYFGTKGLEIRSKRWMTLMPKDCLKDPKELGPVLVNDSLLV
ncbi:terpenoid synthase [Suillus lakei]|nr:terpenoid synthase [Suillus lakei]